MRIIGWFFKFINFCIGCFGSYSIFHGAVMSSIESYMIIPLFQSASVLLVVTLIIDSTFKYQHKISFLNSDLAQMFFNKDIQVKISDTPGISLASTQLLTINQMKEIPPVCIYTIHLIDADPALHITAEDGDIDWDYFSDKQILALTFTNYSKTPMFKFEMPVEITYYEVKEYGESFTSGDIIARRKTRLVLWDAVLKPEKSFTFWIVNDLPYIAKVISEGLLKTTLGNSDSSTDVPYIHESHLKEMYITPHIEHNDKLPTRMPLTKLRDEAEKLGWVFPVKPLSKLPDFIHGLKQAGIDGTIRFYGRHKDHSDYLTHSNPLIEIDKDYWLEYELTPSILRTNSNFDIDTFSWSTENDVYQDIHADRDNAMYWLKNDAEQYKNRNKRFEDVHG